MIIKNPEALTLFIVVPAALVAGLVSVCTYLLIKGTISPGLLTLDLIVLGIASVFALVAFYFVGKAFGAKSLSEIWNESFIALTHDPYSFILFSFPIFSLITFVLGLFKES